MTRTAARHYCHRLGCAGTLGFPVRWRPASHTDPEWPATDTCPACGAEMRRERLDWGAPLLDFLDALHDQGADLDADELDQWALAAAIQTELDRQARARLEPDREPPTHDIPAWLADLHRQHDQHLHDLAEGANR